MRPPEAGPLPESTEEAPLPGQDTVILAALAIGVTLMAVQLWLLTVALDLYLAGNGGQVWHLAVVSGLIFLGGLLMLWLLRRRPHVRRLRAGPPDIYGR